MAPRATPTDLSDSRAQKATATPQRGSSLSLFLSPHGRLALHESDEPESLSPETAARLMLAFARGPGHGLLYLGAVEVGTALPAVNHQSTPD